MEGLGWDGEEDGEDTSNLVSEKLLLNTGSFQLKMYLNKVIILLLEILKIPFLRLLHPYGGDTGKALLLQTVNEYIHMK